MTAEGDVTLAPPVADRHNGVSGILRETAFVDMALLVAQGGEYEAVGPVHGPLRIESGANSLVLPKPSVLHQVQFHRDLAVGVAFLPDEFGHRFRRAYWRVDQSRSLDARLHLRVVQRTEQRLVQAV